MSLAEQLQELAGREEPMIAPMPQEWPEVVWRAYHVGRRAAFTEAAVIAAGHTTKEEGHR